MTDKNTYLLELIDKNYSNEDICKELNITKKQLKRRIESIKYDGYNIDKRYSYNGTYRYYLNREPYKNNKTSIKDIDNYFRSILISDTHLGNARSNIEYIYKMYEYCLKNNINIVFHLGDLFDGIFQSKLNHKEQINYFLNEYPKEDNILTFMAFGNHEEEFLVDSGLNLKAILEKEREDIVPLGYGLSTIDISGNNIFINHQKFFPLDHGLKIQGHSHRYRFYGNSKSPIIVVPTLSDYLHTSDYPGALDMEIKLDNNLKFDKLALKHLTIDNDSIRETSYLEYPFKREVGIKKIR